MPTLVFRKTKNTRGGQPGVFGDETVTRGNVNVKEVSNVLGRQSEVTQGRDIAKLSRRLGYYGPLSYEKRVLGHVISEGQLEYFPNHKILSRLLRTNIQRYLIGYLVS